MICWRTNLHPIIVARLPLWIEVKLSPICGCETRRIFLSISSVKCSWSLPSLCYLKNWFVNQSRLTINRDHFGEWCEEMGSNQGGTVSSDDS